MPLPMKELEKLLEDLYDLKGRATDMAESDTGTQEEYRGLIGELKSGAKDLYSSTGDFAPSDLPLGKTPESERARDHWRQLKEEAKELHRWGLQDANQFWVDKRHKS
jgi:hypothetical protein